MVQQLSYYVRGRVRRFLHGVEVRAPPLFLPTFWSVHSRVDLGIPKTQNKVEAWHRRFEILVGSAHVGLYKLIKEIQKEQHMSKVKSNASYGGGTK